MPGLSTAGFEAKTLEEILEDQKSRARAEFGTNVKTGDDEVLGHLLAIQSEGLFELWQQQQLIYDATNPDNAQGQMLDNVSRVVGVSREPATKASGTVTAYGTDGTVIPIGSIVSAPTLNDAHFLTTAEATIGATVAGEVDLSVEAEVAGALTVLINEVDTIITPVSNWDSALNAADLTAGNAVESDSELRRRREESLAIIGAGTDGSIRAKVVALDDIDTAVVISNRTLTTDGDGIPGKAFRVVVWPDTGVDEDALVTVIFANMPSGIEPDGDEEFTVTDEQGITQTVKFSYADAVAMGVKVIITTKTGWPADGIAQVENALLKSVAGSDATDPERLRDSVGDGLTVGDDVEVLYLSCAIKTVPGIKSIVLTVDRVFDADPPVGTVDIAIAITEIARLDSAKVDVSVA